MNTYHQYLLFFFLCSCTTVIPMYRNYTINELLAPIDSSMPGYENLPRVAPCTCSECKIQKISNNKDKQLQPHCFFSASITNISYLGMYIAVLTRKI